MKCKRILDIVTSPLAIAIRSPVFVIIIMAIKLAGRGELTREEKLELDVKYVETASFLFDIKIILITIAQVFGKKSIYKKSYSKTEYSRGQESKK